MEMQWSPSERPFWRRSANPTSAFLEAIADYTVRYEGLCGKDEEYCTRGYCKDAIAALVFCTNQHEGQHYFRTLDETSAALETIGNTDWQQDANIDPRLRTILAFHKVLLSWLGSDRLTLSNVLESHATLLGDWEAGGRLRKCSTFTMTRFGPHTYTNPRKIRQQLGDLIQTTNDMLSEILQASLPLVERIEKVVKLAVQFFWSFEGIHPFEDGNGRMGRILMVYILGRVLPFPNLFLVEGIESVDRATYLKCFENAEATDTPSDLAALVIEGIYLQWRSLFDMLDTAGPCNVAVGFESVEREVVVAA